LVGSQVELVFHLTIIATENKEIFSHRAHRGHREFIKNQKDNFALHKKEILPPRHKDTKGFMIYYFIFTILDCRR
jgi:hypothetical protein